ncbi:TolC family protein [Balneola sp. MJW-20]|uniref:TolC family protein n=1 Tax=Gracilimonas aurantiaca TaxID=3234185 RepID=UPI003466B1F6
MNTTKLIILIFILTITAGMKAVILAQSGPVITELSLKQAIELTKTHNYDVLLAKQDLSIAKAKRDQANAVFLPQISVEETALKTTDPVAAFGIKLRQGIAVPADFDPAVLNDPDAINNYNTRVEVMQPLFNPDGFYERSAARSGMLSAREKEASVQNMQVFRVKEHYHRLNLLLSKEEALTTSLELAQSIEKQSSDYFDQGLINRAEYLEARVQVLNVEEQLLGTQNQIADAKDNLAILLGMEPGTELILTTPLESMDAESVDVPEGPVRNAGLRALSFQLEASEKALKASRFSFIPKINLFGAYEFNDDQLFGLSNDNYTIGASLRWDLFKGFSQIGKVNQRKAEQRSMKIRYDQQYDQLQSQIRMKERSLNQSLKKIELNSIAAEQAEEEYRIRSNRFDKGLEKVSDLLKAEAQYLNKDLSLLQALYEYQVNLASLEYLLETKF